MTELTLERLAAGIKAANEKGDAALVRQLGAKYRELQGRSQPSGAEPSTGISAALGEGVDAFGGRLSKGVKALGQMTGVETLESIGQAGADKAAASQAERNYQRNPEYDGVVANLKQGELANAAGSLGYGLLESAPSLGAGVVASAAAVASAPVSATAATAVGIMDALGSTQEEKAEKGVVGEANFKDLATAVASGLIELVPAGRAGGGYLVKLAKEGAQEAGQEGSIMTGTALQGGEYVPEEVFNRLGDSAIMGGAMQGGFDASIKTASALTPNIANPRYDSADNFDGYDVLAAQRLVDAADGDPDAVLRNVSSTASNTSAQGAAKNALANVRTEMRNRGKELKKLAAVQGNSAAIDAVDGLLATAGNMKSAVTELDIRRVMGHFPDVATADQLASLSRQLRKLQPLTESKADMGGLGRLTHNFDLFDGRNDSINKGISFVLGAGIPGTVTNRAARLVDVATNRRSTIKRYVDSVHRSGVEAPKTPSGRPADNILAGIKADALAAKQAAKEAAMAPKKQAAAEKLAARIQGKEQKQETLEMNKGLHREATREGWETGKLPDQPAYEPYRRWEERTGMSMQDTYDALKDAENAPDSPVKPGTADRYRDDPRSFWNTPEDKQTAYALQEVLRSNYNPDYKFDESSVGPDPTQVLQKLSAASNKPTGSRRKDKAREGGRRRINLNASIEASKQGVSADQYAGLTMLAEELDSPAITRAERFKMMDRELERMFPDPMDRDQWRKEFSDIAAIGNDVAILREAQQDTDSPEAQAEASFEDKKAEIRKAVAQKERKKSTDAESQSEPTSQPETKADAALKKLAEGPKEEPIEDASPAAVEQAAEELQVDKPKGSTSFRDMVINRVDQLEVADVLAAERGPELAEYRRLLGKSSRDRTEGLIYDLASDRVTQNMLTDAYASEHDVPAHVAADAVEAALVKMEQDGQVERFVPSMASGLKVAGKFKKDVDGTSLKVVQLRITDPEMAERIAVAKAVRTMSRMVNQNGPSKLYAPHDIVDGNHRALKDVPSSGVGDSFRPLLDFQNTLRSTPFRIHAPVLDQIEAGLGGAAKKKVGAIREVLYPTIGTKVVRGRNGKLRSKSISDESPMRTVAQLFYLLGADGNRPDTKFYQEWSAGANGRVYSKNGQAHTQAGDIMKGLTRFAERSKLGGSDGYQMFLHSIGNLLGYDKEAPSVRRQALFQEGTIKTLLSFAKAPFRNGVLRQETKGKPLTAIGKLVNQGEGFFQVLNVAHEVQSMVNWARERHPNLNKYSDEELLQNPDVTSDLADNYETDFIVQLDASNNAYQLLGMVTGNDDMLKATGLASSGANYDPDTQKGGDIYLDPAISVAKRIPELDQLGLPTKKLRKLFKGPIGTFLYEAEFNSRKQAFSDALTEISEGLPIVSVEAGAGLVTVPEAVTAGLSSKEGHTFINTHYDVNGAEKAEKSVRKRVVKSGSGYVVESAEGSGAWKASRSPFETNEQAIESIYEGDLYSRMNRELVRDINMRFPRVQEYLRFSGAVTKIMKERGKDRVIVPSPDGMMLEASFKDEHTYAAKDVPLADGKIVPMGYRTEESRLTGRGLAAFMMHQLDAYVLRETHRRLKAEGRLKTGFNPIHDSFGFPPADAKRGQEVWAEIMQELGGKDFNIFLSVLEANQISLPEFVSPEYKGVLPSRDAVAPVPAQQIPTALS